MGRRCPERPILDASASNATSVEFRLFGGIYGYNAPVLCTATATIYGWLCGWNTTTVPNGSYTLVSVASGAGGSASSSGVSITIKNPPPTTSVLIPSNGATLSGSTYLDASASNATSVQFLLFGGSTVIPHRGRHGHLHHLRMVVRLEHHDGPQRHVHLGVPGLQLGWKRSQFGRRHHRP